jgi:hypothetical protein
VVPTWCALETASVMRRMGCVELERSPKQQETVSRLIYENLLYKAALGATLVSHTPVASDIAYHPNHERYFFVNFASYHLPERSRGTRDAFLHCGRAKHVWIVSRVSARPAG